MIFGHFGDRLGRKKMLLFTLVLMGGVSTMIGVLPTSEQIGVAAPIILVILRIIQGIAMGGEWAGAALMSMEHSAERKRGLSASAAVAGGPAGTILATVVLGAFSLLPEPAFLSWGWRIPFLLSLVLVIIGLYLRFRVTESPEFEKAKNDGAARGGLPILEVFRKHPRTLVLTVLGGLAAIFMQSMINTFGITYAISAGHSRSTALAAVTVAAVFHIFAILNSAALSDRFGRQPVMIAGGILSMILIWPGFALIAQGETWSLFLGFILMAPVAQALWYGPIGAFMSEMYETRNRYTGASMSYQLSSTLGGGFAPLIASGLLIAGGGSITLLNTVFCAICAVSITALILSRKSATTGQETSADVIDPRTEEAVSA